MVTNSIHSCVHLLAMYHYKSFHEEVETVSLLLVGYVTCLGQWDTIKFERSQGLIRICALGLALLGLLESTSSPGLSVA